MKRFFVLLAILFCGVVFADTITINWGVDNQPYTTTTCEVGGDVILPAVSKRGHVFRGWQAEHFDRGTFTNYTSVPSSNILYYHIDYHQSNKPQKGDYITIMDASDYHGDYNNEMFIYKNAAMYGGSGGSNFTFVINDVRTTCTKGGPNYNMACSIPNTGIYVYCNTHSYDTVYIRFYSDSEHTKLISILYNGNISESVSLPWTREASVYVYYPDLTTTYSGTWRFVYDGVWEVDGKNGWKPVEQIVSE